MSAWLPTLEAWKMNAVKTSNKGCLCATGRARPLQIVADKERSESTSLPSQSCIKSYEEVQGCTQVVVDGRGIAG